VTSALKAANRRIHQATLPVLTVACLACAALEETGIWTAAFRRMHPFVLDWPDRRPIGSLFLARDAAGWPGNPRGWFGDPDLDIFSPHGRERFEKRLLALADATIANLQAANAQGVIIWDLEGQQYPHPNASYVGDSTRLVRLAPEMAVVADSLFARFRSTQLRVGLCVRPQILTFRPDGSFVQSEPVLNPRALFESLDRKIGFARQRWGCTLFYIDSNFGAANLGVYDAAIFRQLHCRYPDALLIPEHANLAYFAVSAPYYEPGRPAKWPGTRRLAQDPPDPYVRAFSVINVGNLGITPEWTERLTRWVQDGDVLLFRAWLGGSELELVRTAYDRAQAGRREVVCGAKVRKGACEEAASNHTRTVH
jgi:hypothetical protein